MFTKWIFPDFWHVMVLAFSTVLHQRSAWRLGIIFTAMLFAKGRKTTTNWLRAAGINRCYKAYYYFIGSLGKKTVAIATELLKFMIHRIYKNTNTILMAIDDSPTSRYGPKVAGAGIHRNPTPTPDGRKFVYGHVWVTLLAIARHKDFGTIGLPLLAKMYVKAKDVKSIKLAFKSKTEQAVELAKWAYNELTVTTGQNLFDIIRQIPSEAANLPGHLHAGNGLTTTLSTAEVFPCLVQKT